MIQYCIPLKQIVDRQTTHRGPSRRQPVAQTVCGISHTPKVVSGCSEGSQSGSCLYHCLCYSMALPSSYPPLALSTQDKHMLLYLDPRVCARRGGTPHLRLGFCSASAA